MPDNLITIDGSFGEGGGQMLRTAISLSAALGQPVRVINIRARRPESGLRPQHVSAVSAAAAVCGAKVEGNQIGSGVVTFAPGELSPGSYTIDIGTAGSCPLVLQTLVPPLLYANGDSSITVTGGTHVPLAPCFHYLRDVYGVLASACGAELYFEMRKAGFYPAGGGEVHMELRGAEYIDDVRPVRMSARGKPLRAEVLSAVSAGLQRRMILERQLARAAEGVREAGFSPEISQEVWETRSPGTAVFVRAVFERSVAGFSVLGEIELPAERVAEQAVDEMRAFLDSEAAVDNHAADQLLVLAALSVEESYYLAQGATPHLRSCAAVIEQLTGRKIEIGPSKAGGAVTVRVAKAP
jgi:RNA 3'-terminal phosphate cyclase (ATP)